MENVRGKRLTMFVRFNQLLCLGITSTLFLSSLGQAITVDDAAASPTVSAPAASPEVESFEVNFQPWIDRKVIFRDQAGNELGQVKETDNLQVPIDKEIMTAVSNSSEVSVRTLLSKLPQVTTPAGTMLPVKLELEMTTSNGVVFAAGTQVYVDLRDFLEYKILQPTSFQGGKVEGDEASQLVDKNNLKLHKRGVSKETRPTKAMLQSARREKHSAREAREKIAKSEPAAAETGEGSDPASTVSDIPKGKAEREFLTSPICDCKSKDSNGHPDCQFNEGFGRPRMRSNGHHAVHGIHEGQDYRTKNGTPIVAPAYGCVKSSTQPPSTWGNSILLDHFNGVQTRVAHLSRFVLNPMPANHCFERGEIMGYSGKTGHVFKTKHSDGSHLHLEVIVHGKQVDPAKYLADRTTQSTRMTCGELKTHAQESRFLAVDQYLARIKNGNTAVAQQRSTSVNAAE
jgi:murein DD-endopeptidase MepM/ murein hydrolase activator NlpD